MMLPISSQISVAMFAGVVITIILIGMHRGFEHDMWPLPKSPAHSPTENKWLIATMSPAKSASRRAIIRATWQKQFDRGLFDTRFFLSEYDPFWEPMIQEENRTYGDIIKLEGLDPSPKTSKRLKPMRIFTHLVETDQKYGWVTKIDQDAFFAVGRYYKKYIEPQNRLSNTFIAKKMRDNLFNEFDWPAGAMYTFSWPLLEHMVEQHDLNDDIDTYEDVRIGMYLNEVSVDFEWLDYEGTELVDLPVKRAMLPAQIHGDTMVVHFIKKDDDYLRVADLFNEEGYTGKELGNWTNTEEFAGETPQIPTDPIRGSKDPSGEGKS